MSFMTERVNQFQRPFHKRITKTICLWNATQLQAVGFVRLWINENFNDHISDPSNKDLRSN